MAAAICPTRADKFSTNASWGLALSRHPVCRSNLIAHLQHNRRRKVLAVAKIRYRRVTTEREDCHGLDRDCETQPPEAEAEAEASKARFPDIPMRIDYCARGLPIPDRSLFLRPCVPGWGGRTDFVGGDRTGPIDVGRSEVGPTASTVFCPAQSSASKSRRKNPVQ